MLVWRWSEELISFSLHFLLCILSALRLEFVACNVGQKVHLWWRVFILIDLNYRSFVQNPYPGGSYNHMIVLSKITRL